MCAVNVYDGKSLGIDYTIRSSTSRFHAPMLSFFPESINNSIYLYLQHLGTKPSSILSPRMVSGFDNMKEYDKNVLKFRNTLGTINNYPGCLQLDDLNVVQVGD